MNYDVLFHNYSKDTLNCSDNYKIINDDIRQKNNMKIIIIQIKMLVFI